MMHTAWQIIGGILWLSLALPVAYLYTLALASVHRRRSRPRVDPTARFAIVIPAHDEEGVIGRTVAGMRGMDYPGGLFDVHVVADHCTDGTASAARSAGAVVHERNEGPRTGKGAALRWAFARILGSGGDKGGVTPPLPYGAVVVFDADTVAASDFLKVMDARLAAGDRVIQGQHRIANPEDGLFPALTSAMFLLTNRLQNQGRSNLGFSAGNMGDSICLSSQVLAEIGWGEGLTEDYDLRLTLLLAGIRIVYEPDAVGYGEAPATWALARRQRERWLAGSYRSGRSHLAAIGREALHRGDPALWDGLLQVVLPSYSTLTLLALGAGAVHTLAGLATGLPASPAWLGAWAGLVAALVVYPFLGLALERAPLRAYLAILSGPAFIVWRTWLALVARSRREVTWVRTPRRGSLP